MLRCPLCRREVEKFAKSHIFPLALAKDLGAGAPLAKFGQNRVGVARRGIYAEIVCKACEKQSSRADDELIRFVREVNRKPPLSDQPIELLEVEADNELLQKSFVQMFFRAAICDLSDYQSVNAEVHRLMKIRLALRGHFSVFRSGLEVMLCHRNDPLGRSCFVALDLVSVDGCSYYEFGLPGFSVSIADGFLPLGIRGARLRREGKVYVLSAPLDTRERMSLSDALAKTGGLPALNDFFSSPRGRY